MSAIVTTLHVIACIFLITVVLLQRGKGAQVGAVFGGGGGATMFGGRGAGNFLTKLTTAAATVFMITSLSLSYLGITGQDERLFESGAPAEAGAEEESLFEEFGTVPAEAAGALEETAQGAADAARGAAAAAGAALDEAATEASAALDEAATETSAAVEEAVTGVEAAADEAVTGVEGVLDEASSETNP